MSSQPTTLGSAASERKARLAKLKSLKRKQPEDEIVPPVSTRESSHPPAQDPTIAQDAVAAALSKTTLSSSSHPHPHLHNPSHLGSEARAEQQRNEDNAKAQEHLSLRNYEPATRGPKLGFEVNPLDSLQTPTLEERAAAISDDTANKEKEEDAEEGLDLFKLRPRKPNWDLKRDLEGKLEVLGVRTQNAINRAVRERIAAASGKTRGGGSGAGKTAGAGEKNGDEGFGGGIDGVALVEGLKVREREEEEEERRERAEIEHMS